ncbi:hypothetical protein [Natrinema halophilum]|uniref:Uncharacterized protein n=1 Tax=Natrinema halophilum TaxID=1699371 RepID=A0A7D5KFA6_9EURY|nr:hypothetical protein [Natrinema halophilum]QLG50721.1 hypothetical protein HYG82_18710 [Natrinema halophilum]
MTGDNEQTQFERRGNERPTGILDVLLAELEADDGERAAALRWTLDVEENGTEEKLETLQNELMSLRSEVNQLSAAGSERQSVIENQIKPRFLTLERRLSELDDELTSVRAEMRGLRSEFTDIRNSLENIEANGGSSADVDAVAAELNELEQTVADAFQSVTSNLENDLESLQATYEADIDALRRRLRALEVESRTGKSSQTGAEQNADDNYRRY